MSIPRILHYPGSKWSMAEWIISNMPQHTTYLEPYFGSGAVLFSKQRAKLETVNDINGSVTNLFRVIRDRKEELSESIRWTPYSREEYEMSYHPPDEANEVERARIFLIRCWMARWVKTNKRTGWRHVVDWDRRPLSPAKEWTDLPHKILQTAERLHGVQIECEPALKVIERYQKSNVLIYADPPYLLDVRRGKMYEDEMSEDDHVELLAALKKHPGPAIVSGYAHDLYDDTLSEWKRETRRVQAEAGEIRTEVIWINPVAAAQVGGQLTMNL
ncbi:DNA adenine methylase [Paenibacillus alvei]|uniref:DNA methyltransferase n=1 Tax=Paenibacillus alvei TaxID=44250 RepID=A0A383RD64_PAEAL|nr:DNA adenine methylase [Paenibacillus alvei]SYX84641.1 DNA methyltransferase [Paenibacillus alvei]